MLDRLFQKQNKKPEVLLSLSRKLREEKIKELRWTYRTLPQHVKGNLSPLELQYFKGYDQLLNKYMRSGRGGWGLDLTVVCTASLLP